MARGRHVRRTGLLARLWPSRSRRTAGRAAGPVVGAHVGTHVGTAHVAPVGVDRFTALEAEVARLQVLADLSAADAAAAVERARRAEQQLDEVRGELVGLRGELAALREELVWAFAGGKVEAPPRPVGLRTIDLRATGTAG